jgi:hypothetical protein
MTDDRLLALRIRHRLRGATSSRVMVAAATLGLAALLLWGLIALFGLRYSRGDIYPPYSSLRADPLGTKALYEVFERMPGFSPGRNFRPLVRLKATEPVTLLYAGLGFDARWGDDELPQFEKLITSGSRAVFAFQREFKTTDTQRLGNQKATPAPVPGATPAPKAPVEEEPGIAFTEVGKRWGFAFDLAQDEENDVLNAVAEPEPGAGELEPTVPWHSALYFKGLSPNWRVLYRCNGVPVIIEREFGQGSIVLASDCFFLSNEGLREARAAKLIAQIVGPPRRVIFDEEHHGVTEDMNLVGLARKHGFEAVLAATGIVLALALWRSMTMLLPRRSTVDSHASDVRGADAGEGFVNLLRRSIPGRQILETCVDEWRKSRGRRIRPEEIAHVDSVVRAHQSRGASGANAAAAYRTIAEGLARR